MLVSVNNMKGTFHALTEKFTGQGLENWNTSSVNTYGVDVLKGATAFTGQETRKLEY